MAAQQLISGTPADAHNYDEESEEHVYQNTHNIISSNNDNSRPSSRARLIVVVFITILATLNLVVISLAIKAVTSSYPASPEATTSSSEMSSLEMSSQKKSEDNGGKKECVEGRSVGVVVPSLCVPCGQEVGGDEEDWRRVRGEEGELCCPSDYLRLSSAVKQVYLEVSEETQREFFNQSNGDTSRSMFLEDDDPNDLHKTLLFTNRQKPSGHVTGVQKFDPEKYYLSGSSVHPVGDWPTQMEEYRSGVSGYVHQLSWGLQVPTSGLYRLHSSVNFYFNYPSNKQARDPVSVVHEISRYRARDQVTSMLTQRNQSVSGDHCDGVTSFLVTLAELDAGDVIGLSVSHAGALSMQDRWHSEGLFLVQ